MANTLACVNLTQSTAPPGLVATVDASGQSLALDEHAAIQQAARISPAITHVFFRRFDDGRSSHVAAYVVADADSAISNDEIARLHHRVWLSGAAPLLYVGRKFSVDIFSCAAEGRQCVSKKTVRWEYKPDDIIDFSKNISKQLNDEKKRQYSAFRLADGTFWEDGRNAKLVDTSKSAHKFLIDKVKSVDVRLDGARNHLARRLLLVSIFIKYLEDRGVFPIDENGNCSWFSGYVADACSFYDVLNFGSPNSVRRMFAALQDKFNGDIFSLPETETTKLDAKLLRTLADLIDAKSDKHGQLYFWDMYSFTYIPVEVLSHIYQHFAEDGHGAVFTPPLLVNLLLDQVLPLTKLRGNERVLDPTCGSGIFLVGAFKRLICAWSARNGWERPTPAVLTQLLANTIFGVERQAEAVDVAAFSLALAICDALHPAIIWNELRFSNIQGRNLLVGDFEECIERLPAACSGDSGFDVIVGNPPFLSGLTKAMSERCAKENFSIPDKQVAYYVIKRCAEDLLSCSGVLCMIQPSGFLYNSKVAGFVRDFFKKTSVETVLDFISMRGLFSGADTKVVAVIARNKDHDNGGFIRHYTFRRTHSANGMIQFELDCYDQHEVPQKDAESLRWAWRANVLGGGRTYHLAQKLSEFPKFKDYLETHGFSSGEGYIAGSPNKGKPCSWLSSMAYLPSRSFGPDGIREDKIATVPDKVFAAKRTRERFSAPLLLIKEHHTLPSQLWDRCDLAYRAQIVGITPKNKNLTDLKRLAERFKASKDMLRVSCYLLGSRLLGGKATALLKDEIDNLPWPADGNWNLKEWEKIFLFDILRHIADFVRRGQDSALLRNAPSQTDVDAYGRVFVSSLRYAFPDIRSVGSETRDGLRYYAFSFDGCDATWGGGDWFDSFREMLFNDEGAASSLRTVRIVRWYSDKTIFIVKPNTLRYWIQSVAVLDIDSVIVDIME